jgi:hypothetical protein
MIKKPHVDKYIPQPGKKRKLHSSSALEPKQHRKCAESDNSSAAANMQTEMHTNYKGVSSVVDVEEDLPPSSSSSNLRKLQQKKTSVVLIKSFQTLYSAELRIFDKTIQLGRFNSAMLAAMAHDRAR